MALAAKSHLINATVAAALLLLPMAASLPEFFKFGVSEGDSTLVKAEDAAVMITLKYAPFMMYGKSYFKLVLYDNGYIGVGSTTGGKTPYPFPFTSGSSMIAAYWADVDTTNLGTVYYRETRDSAYLEAARDEIRAVYGGTFTPTTLFIATWDKVGYCCSNTGPEVNSFQVVLATDAVSSYVIFRYGEIQWTTGDKSGGSGGFGGSEAVVGFNAGDRINYVSVIGSGMPEIVDIETQTNVMRPGVFMFQTDNPQISPMPFSLYPFGAGNSDQVLPLGDNSNSGVVSLTTPAIFYGKSVDKIIVYEDGYIGLGGATSGSSPQSFLFSDSNGVLAPFWADAARSSTTGSVYYRETTESALLSRAMYEIMLAYGGTVSISSLFIATWDQVGFASNGFDKLNTFQAVIATDLLAGQSYVIFLYDTIQWTQSAIIGLNAGDGNNHFTLPQSGTAELANLETSSNTGLPGEFILSAGNAALYPFGPMFADRTLGHVDDHSIFVYLRTTPFTFYGKSGRNLRVYSNGYIAVGGSFGGYCPSSLPTDGSAPIIAPYWADADVSSGVGGIYFRETSDPCILDRCTYEIRSLTGDANFVPTSAFVATWSGVGYNSMHTDKLNSFQVVLAMDGQSSYTLFLYKDLQWTTSDACGSHLPQAGISAGDGVRSTSLPSSGTANILSLTQTSSAGVPGLYILSTTTGTTASVNSDYRYAYHQHKPSATKHVYTDPKMRIAMEMEMQKQSLLNQWNFKEAEMNHAKDPHPHDQGYARKEDGHFQYRLKYQQH